MLCGRFSAITAASGARWWGVAATDGDWCDLTAVGVGWRGLEPSDGWLVQSNSDWRRLVVTDAT